MRYRMRLVETLKPITPTDRTGICSRCNRAVDKDAVELNDGTVAHRHHFHPRDIVRFEISR